MRRNARVALVAAAIAVAVAVVLFHRASDLDGVDARGSSAAAPNGDEQLATAVPREAAEPASIAATRTGAAQDAADTAGLAELRERLTRSSLRDTQRDGSYTLGADGRLLLDAALVRVFDYWLTLTGEWPDADIRALLLADAREAHGDAVARQVEAAFERYLGLRAQLASASLSKDLAERLEQLRAIRRAWFGPDAHAMFGAEEAQIAYTLERQRLATADLAPAERDAALDALEQARPASARAAQTDTSAALIADEQTRHLDATGADARQRHAEREALWGPQAAERFARLDAERAAWDRRIADYLRDRAGLSSTDAATLRTARFTPEERARIEALEAIGALGSAAPGG